MIDKIIEFNKQFVASKSYEQYILPTSTLTSDLPFCRVWIPA